MEKSFKSFRSALLLSWLLSNVMFVYAIASQEVNRNMYINFLFLTVLVFIGFRTMGSIYFILDRLAWLGYRKIKKAREDMENRKRIKAQNLRKKNESRARRNVSSDAPLRGEEHV